MPLPSRRRPAPAAPRSAQPPRRPRRGFFASARRPAVPPLATGRDVSAQAPPRRRLRVRPSSVAIVAAGALCAALLLAALRMESIKLRYELAAAIRAEQELLAQQRLHVVERRRLRHPMRLEELGHGLGLVPPARLVEVRAAPGAEPPR